MERVHHIHTSRQVASAIFGSLGGIARRFRDRREMNALLKMDDYMLKDIGISRSDVQRGSTKSLWRD